MDPSFSAILSHTPRLLQEQMAGRTKPLETPLLEESQATILFCDIAGFSKITEKVAGGTKDGVTELVEILDTYIGLMVDIILKYDGDIVKFAGDALFAVWPVSKTNALKNVLMQALRCGLKLKETVNRFEIKNLVLDARLALGCGNFIVYHAGGIFGRWELLLAGEAMSQAARAGQAADSGELVITREIQTLLKPFGTFKKTCDPQKQESDNGHTGGAALLTLEPDQNGAKQELYFFDKFETPYTPRPVIDIPPASESALRAYIPRAVLTEIDKQESKRVADYRTVSVIFLKVCSFNFKKAYDETYVNEIMQIMQRCLYQYEGSINRFGLDDKGAVLLAAFGLPPLEHEDDPLRAVKAAFRFHDLFSKNNLECVIGIGTGPVFCGTVGSPSRSEYTMHGTIVNMTAGLMQASEYILCDEATYLATKNDFEYKKKPPVKVKAHKDPVPVYSPMF